MGERENIIAIVESYLKKAESKLKSAKILLENEMYEDSISRAYYAAFLSSKALLLFIGESPKTHSGLITIFGLKFVKTNKVDVKYAKILSKLLNAKLESDYKPLTWNTKIDAEESYEQATLFVDEMKKLFENLRAVND